MGHNNRLGEGEEASASVYFRTTAARINTTFEMGSLHDEKIPEVKLQRITANFNMGDEVTCAVSSGNGTTVVTSCPVERIVGGDADDDGSSETTVHLGMVIAGTDTIAIKRTQFYEALSS